MVRWLLIVLCLLAVTAYAADNWTYTSNWCHNPTIRTAMITYCSTCWPGDTAKQILGDFCGRKFDLLINPSGEFLDSARAANIDLKVLDYQVLMSIRESDFADIDSFCTNRSYTSDSIFLWVETDSVKVWSPGGGGTCNSDSSSYYVYSGDTLSWCYWSETRYAFDFRHEEAWEFIRWKVRQAVQAGYEGVMEDEAHYFEVTGDYPVFPFPAAADWEDGGPDQINGWSGEVYADILDSMIALWHDANDFDGYDTLTKYVADSGWGLAANITTSQVNDLSVDNYHLGVAAAGGGIINIEYLAGAPSPIAYVQWADEVWSMCDSLIAYDTGWAIMWNTYFDGGVPNDEDVKLGDNRVQIWNLAFYLMGVSTAHDRFFFMMSGNNGTECNTMRANDFGWNALCDQQYQSSDTLKKWFGALTYDVGYGDSARYVDSTGTDPESQSFTLYRTDYTRDDLRDVVVYLRIKNGTNYDTSTAVKVGPGGTFRELMANGTLGTATDSFDVYNAHGLILIEDVSPAPVKPEDNTVIGNNVVIK